MIKEYVKCKKRINKVLKKLISKNRYKMARF